MKKVLIIGGTGTISSPVTRGLSKRDDIELYVLNRGGKNKGLPSNINIIKCDANDEKQMEAALARLDFDVVCNFVLYTPQQAEKNIKLFGGKTAQYILISTVAAYDHEISCNCNEETPMGNRFSGYGRDKQRVEEVFMEAYRRHGFPITVVRPTQTYSEARIPLSVKGKSCWSVIDRMLKGKEVIVHDSGQSVWASTHADDFAAGFIGLIGNSGAIGEAYQIMNNEPHTWDMVYRELARLLKVEYKPVYIPSGLLARSKKYDLLTAIQGDKRASCIFDISKIQEAAPQFRCQIPINKGLAMYLDFMGKHPEMKIEEPDFDAWCDAVILNYKKTVDAFAIE